MDGITHLLSGAVVSRLGFSQKIGSSATAAVVIGSILPDIDYIMRFAGPLESLKYHRGITHSFFGGAILAAALAAVIWKVGSYKKYRDLWFLSYLAIVMHIFLDLITSYGTQVLLPFEQGRYALDLLFIIDLPFSAIFLMFLAAGWVWKKYNRPLAMAGLILASLYIGMAAVNHHLAGAQFRQELAAQEISAPKVAVLPQPGSPFRWSAIATNDGEYYQTVVDLLQHRSLTIQRVDNHLDNKYIRKTRDLEVVRFYQWFARFPLVNYYQEGEHHIVEYKDLRFRSTLKRQPFLLRIVLDDEGEIIKQGFGKILGGK